VLEGRSQAHVRECEPERILHHASGVIRPDGEILGPRGESFHEERCDVRIVKEQHGAGGGPEGIYLLGCFAIVPFVAYLAPQG